jgi:hypothetical protein
MSVHYVSLEIELNGLSLEKNDDVAKLLSEIENALHEVLESSGLGGRGSFVFLDDDVKISLLEYAGNTVDDVETRDFKKD